MLRKKYQSRVRYVGIDSSPFVVQSGVLQDLFLGHFLFNIPINDLYDIINHSKCLLFAENLRIYLAISLPHYCFLLRLDIDCAHKWCLGNFMKPNFSKIRSISRKTNVLN
jgi:hypothetical protein